LLNSEEKDRLEDLGLSEQKKFKWFSERSNGKMWAGFFLS